jgi:hypothetical protein
LKIAQDMLHDRQMRLPRVMHMQTDLLHNVGDVGPCEGQVLESPCNTLKLGSIMNRRPEVYSELRLEVDRAPAILRNWEAS